eukprot:CAMPEP_0119030944 /NCGR_PEP_ID=MMETSP1176-20130426/41287_1 /TAXON_ID=265551 /ORGANISM="Synedropsis recta cf, Strain CCMP1620" /LENGTH=367 /DNA_ID=CAMNT_0006987325 /DNA_START=64 /DNA_END=1168 /DNA_ORIENTATION=-
MFSFFNELFNGGTEQHAMAVVSRRQEPLPSPVKRVEGRKRLRRAAGLVKDAHSRTVAAPVHKVADEYSSTVDEERPLKKQRSIPAAHASGGSISKRGDASHLLNMVPDDAVSHILSFCGGVEDRFTLQATCKTFRRISNDCEDILNNVSLGGDVTGKGGIIQEEDTPETAEEKLTPFAKAGNLEALYMLGMLKSYCDHEVDEGINLLKGASKRGYVRATYTLGLILRDLKPREARHYMNEAAEKGYLPALQEVLPAREMKAKYGEPSAGELCQYLDPVCLNRLLGRTYVLCPHLRDLNPVIAGILFVDVGPFAPITGTAAMELAALGVSLPTPTAMVVTTTMRPATTSTARTNAALRERCPTPECLE